MLETARRMKAAENGGGTGDSDVRLGATKIINGVSTSSLSLHSEHSHQQQQGSPHKEPDLKAFNHFHVKDQPRRNRQAADDDKAVSHMQQVRKFNT